MPLREEKTKQKNIHHFIAQNIEILKIRAKERKMQHDLTQWPTH